MNLIFTCGGTAGHINPAIAVANRMKERYPECNILFIGASGHMEEKLVPQAGFEVKCLPGSGLNPDSDGNTVIEAEVPMGEMSSYAIDLRAMTQARGSFTLSFERYEEVPKANQAKIIEEAKNEE